MGDSRRMQSREAFQSTPCKAFGKHARKSISHTSVSNQGRNAGAQELEDGTVMTSNGPFALEVIKQLYQMRRIRNAGAQSLKN
jgi:hypothetical protein